MKRVIALVVLLLMLITTTVQGGHVPMENATRNSVGIFEGSDITLIAYYASMRVRRGFTSVNTSMIIHNTGDERELVIGIPVQLSNNSRIRNLSVSVEEQNQRVTEKNNAVKIDSIHSPSKWYTWTIELGPGEIKVVDCAFAMDNMKHIDGTEEIFIPLKYLNLWNGPVKYVQITADLDFYPPYVFDPSPSVMPAQYDEVGRIMWSFYDISSPEDIKLYFRPVRDAIMFHFRNLDLEEEIKNALNQFSSKKYYYAAEAIEGFLMDTPGHIYERELKYILGLCYMELFMLKDALEIFMEIKDNPGFGDIRNKIRDKIIYDNVFLIKSIHGYDEALEYLMEAYPEIKRNHIFKIWAENEIKLLSPIHLPSEEEIDEAAVDSVDEEGVEGEKEKAPGTIKSVMLFGHEISLEIIFVALIILIVVASIIIGKRKRKKRPYLFR